MKPYNPLPAKGGGFFFLLTSKNAPDAQNNVTNL